jgi:RHS repeat-associated protein
VRAFDYDQDGRVVREIWYNTVADADLDQDRQNTIAWTYDESGNLLSVVDSLSSYSYAYDSSGRVTTEIVSNAGGPVTVITTEYGTRLDKQPVSRSATVDGVPDFVNLYEYDAQDRLVALWPTRSGRALAAGIVDDRAPATSRKLSLGLAASRIGLDGSVRWMPRACPVEVRVRSYDSPARGFLSVSPATAVATASPPPSRAKRGFREGRLCSCQRNHLPDKPGAFGYTTGDHNRLITDSTYNYDYDAEGNRTRRTEIATGEVTEYTWDHRNRLIRVSTRTTNNGPLTTDTSYAYDTLNRWIARSHDPDGDGPRDFSNSYFVYDGTPPSGSMLDLAAVTKENIGQIVLHFEAEPQGDPQLAHRYLWGPAVDQILADEQITDPTAPGNILWPLTDHLNTVRDLAAYDADTATTTIVNHLIYDAYGRLVAQRNPNQTTLFAFTARPFDQATGLQNNLNRWYDPETGRWLSEDPIGFEAADVNLYRYVENIVTTATDPSGQQPPGTYWSPSANMPVPYPSGVPLPRTSPEPWRAPHQRNPAAQADFDELATFVGICHAMWLGWIRATSGPVRWMFQEGFGRTINGLTRVR